MAVIDKRRDDEDRITYRVRVRVKGHPLTSATFPTLAEARRWATMVEADLRDRNHFGDHSGDRKTLTDALDRYVPTLSPKRLKATRAQVRYWRDLFGSKFLSEISPGMIAEARDALRKSGRAPATVVRYLATLAHLLSVALREWQWIDRNPAQMVKRPKEPRGRVRYLTADELRRLLAATSTDAVLHLAVMLSLTTGARQGEIMGLTWARVDLVRGLALVEDTKNGQRRTLVVTGPALALLRAHPRAPGSDLVFPSERVPGKVLDLRKRWTAAMAAAGITDFRWHDLRHTAASYFAMNGATMGEIGEILGHKSAAMTKRYAHLSPEHLVGVSARMTGKVFAALPVESIEESKTSLS